MTIYTQQSLQYLKIEDPRSDDTAKWGPCTRKTVWQPTSFTQHCLMSLNDAPLVCWPMLSLSLAARYIHHVREGTVGRMHVMLS
ncbi:hypothetical protein CERSUDRAFT_83751 [Gelatoporia subvermispora B]|uniref:Uncharacterized protein n=1 Tax=Ceriporiopsis subvermispora (strain B) TaxID=914234 RepID=M2RE16_CERS8|nr:hypothetical protein CERSUDRAFT_83751 [Gelatoporia subvermispora B]